MKKNLFLFIVIVLITICGNLKADNSPTAPPGCTVFVLGCGKYVVVPGDISGEEAANLWEKLNDYYC